MTYDDGVEGQEQQLNFRIEGKTATLDYDTPGHVLPPIDVSAKDYMNTSWPTMRWGSGVYVSADRSSMPHVREAIKEASTPDRHIVHTNMGWKKIDSRWRFITSNGVIGAEEKDDIEVQLDGLENYSLREPVLYTRDALCEAVQFSLSFLDIAPDRITFPLLAAPYRAPLNEFLYMDAAIWVWGPTGSLKTSLVAEDMKHFGGNFARDNSGLHGRTRMQASNAESPRPKTPWSSSTTSRRTVGTTATRRERRPTGSFAVSGTAHPVTA